MLHFQYKIYVSPNNRYGVKDNDQDRWDGMIGEILNGVRASSTNGVIPSMNFPSAAFVNTTILSCRFEHVLTFISSTFSPLEFTKKIPR